MMITDNLTDIVPVCPCCSGDGYLLGSLGATFHFRCRDCGIDYTIATKRTETEDERRARIANCEDVRPYTERFPYTFPHATATR